MCCTLKSWIKAFSFVHIVLAVCLIVGIWTHTFMQTPIVTDSTYTESKTEARRQNIILTFSYDLILSWVYAACYAILSIVILKAVIKERFTLLKWTTLFYTILELTSVGLIAFIIIHKNLLSKSSSTEDILSSVSSNIILVILLVELQHAVIYLVLLSLFIRQLIKCQIPLNKVNYT